MTAPRRHRALVTGASGDLGEAICKRLAANDCFIYAHANSRVERVQELAAQIRTAGGEAEVLAFDVTDHRAVRDALEPIADAGAIQIIVNNAGVHDDAVLAGMSASQWHRVIDVSLHGFFHVTQTLLLPMLRTRWGRIVNTSSVTALIGNRGQVNYAAAKGALNAATKSLSLEVASRGVTVNAVAPGIIEGGSSLDAFDAETIARLVPMKRAGTPAEVAHLVEFLCSEQAGYITGQIISISGGLA